MSKKYTFREFLQQVKDHNGNCDKIEIISDYIDTHSPLSCRCKICGNVWIVPQAKNLYYAGCWKCGIKKRANSKTFSHSRFLKKLDSEGFDYSNIIFLTQYQKNNLPIKCKCKICDFEWETTPTKLRTSQGCLYCNNRVVRNGFNDFITLYPDKLKYIVNINDVINCSSFSKKIVKVKCPDCETTKSMSICNLSIHGFTCSVCNDGISYPNKLARNLLQFLPVLNLCHEYYTDWSEGRYYDNYFEYDNKSYIIEMDGGWHFKDNTISGQTKEESKQIDERKDFLAQQHSIEVIRINCYPSNFENIKQNIINSKLNILFDLSQIDWDECDKLSQKSLVKDVCDYFNENINLLQCDVSNQFHLSTPTVAKYLRIGTKFGWCNFEDVKKRMYKKQKSNSRCISVSVFDKHNILISTYISMSECARQLSKLYNERITAGRVKYCCDYEKTIHENILRYEKGDE